MKHAKQITKSYKILVVYNQRTAKNVPIIHQILVHHVLMVNILILKKLAKIVVAHLNVQHVKIMRHVLLVK